MGAPPYVRGKDPNGPFRNPHRIRRITAKLLRAWLLCPQQRLGQLVANISNGSGSRWNDSLVNVIEDTDFEVKLDAFLELVEKAIR
jgi:hypothetical protein